MNYESMTPVMSERELYDKYLAALHVSMEDFDDWLADATIWAVNEDENNVIVWAEFDGEHQIQRWFSIGTKGVVSVDFQGENLEEVVRLIINSGKLN